MIDYLLEIFGYTFMRNALFAGLMASVIFGLVGTFVVVKRIVFISGGISHASFGGVGMAVFLGLNPLLGAAVFAVASALGIGAIGRQTIQREDTAIGIVWAVGMALGAFFISITPGYPISISSFLFGNIIMLRTSDLYLMLFTTLSIVVVTVLLYPRLQAVCFDEEFSRSVGASSHAIYLTLLVMVALSVVVLIRFVGIILVIAMLAIPASIAGEFTYDLKKIIIVSTSLSVLFVFMGLVISFARDSIAGATIVMLAGSAFLLVMVAKKIFRHYRHGKKTHPA